MSSKEQLPTLTGQKFKTRTRDRKIKYDPDAFCEVIVTKINECQGDLDAIAAIIGKEGEKQDYRRYKEPLFDILIAGGMLSPGGIVSEVMSKYCVFTCEPNTEAIRENLKILIGLLRRYRYLQKHVKDEVEKVITYLKQFTEQQRTCLAIYTALCISENIVSAGVIFELFREHLVKDESLSLAFATTLFTVWLKEKSIGNVGSALRKVNLESQLLNILPPAKRRDAVFDEHFTQAGLQELVVFRKTQQSSRIRKKLKEEVDEFLKTNTQVVDITDHCQETLENNDTLTVVNVTVILWKSIMSVIEWNKKEDLLAEQALRHLETWSDVFLPFCEQGIAQWTLLLQVQEFCYENMNFMKVFHKIILLLYNNDVISEQAILKWYKDNTHLGKGKSVFLPQMKKMVDWLETAEEESD